MCNAILYEGVSSSWILSSISVQVPYIGVKREVCVRNEYELITHIANTDIRSTVILTGQSEVI